MSSPDNRLSPETTEELLQGLESAANFIRGASLDPRIPGDVRSAFIARAREIEAVCEKGVKEVEGA